jgi:mannose-6-phosphate isomerase-like protein (cupin superfamily)
MADYTVVNLERDVEDLAKRFGHSPNLETHFARGALGTTNLGVSLQRLAPGFRIPFGHRHAEQEEVYVVVSGSGRMKIADDLVELKRWDAVRVGPSTIRGLEAGPDGIELIAIGVNLTDEGRNDAEMVQGWWSD